MNIEPFRELIEQRNRLAKVAVRNCAAEALAIVQSGDRDAHRIETCLDQMLDFCFDDVMLRCFKKLCRYYFQIDPNAVAFYVHSYRELWDDEQEPNDVEN